MLDLIPATARFIDFAKNGSTSVQDFINRYAAQKIKTDAPLTYLEYNWALNEQQ